MKKEIIILFFLMGCTSKPLISLKVFEEVTYQKTVILPGIEYEFYEWSNETERKTVKHYSKLSDEINYYVKKWEAVLLSIYEPSVAPYPGVVTREIDCGEYYLPEKINSSAIISYAVFKNAQKVAGVCAEDLIEDYCLIFFKECNGKLLESEYCVQSKGEKHDFTSFAEKISC